MVLEGLWIFNDIGVMLMQDTATESIRAVRRRAEKTYTI
jgi:hypothetical protein